MEKACNWNDGLRNTGLEVLNKRLAVSITDTLIDWCSKLDLILFQ